jgi:hypothetical protein
MVGNCRQQNAEWLATAGSRALSGGPLQAAERLVVGHCRQHSAEWWVTAGSRELSGGPLQAA